MRVALALGFCGGGFFCLLLAWLFFLQALAQVIFVILLLIFVDPCAGRHSLSLLRQRK
jgi:hypothetical protein